MLKERRRGPLEVVFVWKFDRFARILKALISSLELCRLLGIDFVSVTDAVDTSLPAGELVFEMIGAIALKPNIESLLIQKPVSSPAQSTHASSAEAHRGSLSLEAALFPSKIKAEYLLAQHCSSTFVPDSLQASPQTSARISVLSP